MNKFREWYMHNANEITWFLIGFLVSCGLYALGNNQPLVALVDFALAYVNYVLNKR
jgi:hypothetical protein